MITLADVVRVIEAEQVALNQRITAYAYLPNAFQCAAVIAMMAGCQLQNAHILYLLHLMITSGGESDGKV